MSPRLAAAAAAAGVLALSAAVGWAQPTTVDAEPPLRVQSAAGDWVPKLVPRSCAQPLYPPASQRAAETGTTRVRLVVSETGEVTDVDIVSSSGFPRLDAATKEALSVCRFTPARDSAGQPMKSGFGMAYTWRSDNAVAPDPWSPLRARNGAGFVASTDLAGVPFGGTSAVTPEQRLRILQRLQQHAGEQSGCRSIEQVNAADAPPDIKASPLRDKDTGREIPSIRELWTVTECGLPMHYALVVRMPDDLPATFLMTPVGDAANAPSAAQEQRARK